VFTKDKLEEYARLVPWFKRSAVRLMQDHGMLGGLNEYTAKGKSDLEPKKIQQWMLHIKEFQKYE